MNLATVFVSLAVCAQPPSAVGEPSGPAADDVRTAITRGVDFLLKDQNADGSWGGPQDSITTWSGEVWASAETFRAWQVATTGLCVAALLEAGTSEESGLAADRAIKYLVDNANVKRANVWDTMNSWAYIYGLQGLAVAYGHPRYAESPLRSEIAEAVPKYLDDLSRFQSLNGGWGYLEFDLPRTRRPQGAMSFTTAAAIVSMEFAKRQGFDVDQKVVDRAVRIVNRCRLPNGAYTYRVRNVPNLHSEYIDQVKGALSRIQVCQSALMLAGQEIPLEDRRFGLAHFFRDHKFLEIAMHRPVPHEAFYYNSGYFYMFGHYYAALVIERMPPEERSLYWPKLQREILKVQQKDGSIWDYDMHRYDRPYGVAFGLMALVRSLEE